MTGRHRIVHVLRPLGARLGTAGTRTALVAVVCLLLAAGTQTSQAPTATAQRDDPISLAKARVKHHAKHATRHRAHHGRHRQVRHTKRPVRHVSVKQVTTAPTKTPPKPKPAPAPPKVTQPKTPVRHDVTTIVKETSTRVTAVRATSALLVAGDVRVAPLPAPVGFGAATTGGAGGAVYHVTSSADSLLAPAPGTLRYGLTLGVPTWVVFDRDMQIHLAGGLRVPSNTTIDGRGHQVLVTGHGMAGLLVWDATNVIVENLTLRDFGDTLLTISNDASDAIDLQRSSRVWIDHCTLSHAGDKLIQVVGGSKDITVSWNRFYDQEQVVQIGTMASALADTATTVTMHHNFFDHVGYRLPLVAYAKAHVYNNYMLDWSVSGVRSERLAQVYLENNVLSGGLKPKAAVVTVASTCNDAGTYCDPRQGYLSAVGNLLTGAAKLAASGPGRVFAPSEAYGYTAEPATTTLASRVASYAGAH